MNHPNFILLYVGNPTASAAFYTNLLAVEPVEASPTFAMFSLDSGVMLGLWGRDGVEPKATAGAGASELAFAVENDAEVEARFADWESKGIPITQALTRMDFGYTFVGEDPDGHRLRVFSPGHP